MFFGSYLRHLCSGVHILFIFIGFCLAEEQSNSRGIFGGPWWLRRFSSALETNVTVTPDGNYTETDVSNKTTVDLLTASENNAVWIATTRQTTTPNCKTYSAQQLYSMLEEIGERNQRFMAQTPDEAAKSFSKLIPEPETLQNNGFSSEQQGSNRANSCGSKCLEIKRKLQEAMSTLHEGAVGDTGPLEVQEGKRKTPRHMCSLERFIPIGNCTQRGEEEVWGFEKLCSACQGVYMLGSRCFPKFFNAILCDRKDSRCIFDWWTTSAHGKCRPKTLSFTVMRNVGTQECEEWVYENLQVPIACECYLSKSSWLKA